MKTLPVAAALTAAMALHFSPPAIGQARNSIGPDLKEWQTVVDKAIKFVESTQDENGGWSTDKSPGVTGVVLTGLLKTGRITAKDPIAERALKYIEGLVNPTAKHIAGKDPKVQL